MSFIVVIPARYESQRLPHKMLAMLVGQPLVHHVVGRAVQSQASQVFVATDAAKIADSIQGAKFNRPVKVMMTDSQLPSGTSRIAALVTALQLPDDCIVVNVQGDEPLMATENINQVADLLANDKDCEMASLYEEIEDYNAVFNPNVVKVIVDNDHRAIYFSRAPIPWDRQQFNKPVEGTPIAGRYLQHLGIYAYRVGFLQQFAKMPYASIAECESLEQLTALYHGAKIKMARATVRGSFGVDTLEDLRRAADCLACAAC